VLRGFGLGKSDFAVIAADFSQKGLPSATRAAIDAML
jgi:hypothetical protein